MSHKTDAVKRQGAIKSFQFLLEGSCADWPKDLMISQFNNCV